MFDFFKHKPLILFYSSRRGGSTLLAQILATEPNVGYIDQPFDLWKPESNRGKIIASYLPKKSKSQFFELNADEYIKVKYYLNQIYRHKLQVLTEKPKAKQLVLKIVNAHGLIDEFPTMVSAKTIVMLRHPFSQALSVVRNGWGTCESPFLSCEEWTSNYLTYEQLKFANRIVATGSYVDRAILNWCLEWIYPVHFSKTESLKLYYEDLVLHGEQTIIKLYDYLGFLSINDAIQELTKPSKSSAFSTFGTKQSITSGNKEALVSSWKEHIQVTQQAKGQEILSAFNMNMYNMHSSQPQL